MKFLVSAVMALVVVLAPGVSATAQTGVAQASLAQGPMTDWRPKEGPFFNAARTTLEREYVIEREIVAAIRHARVGSYIRISVFSFDRLPVADALIDARRRGVNVQMLFNGHQNTMAMRKMRNVLGADTTRRNFAYICDLGCRGGGSLHAKMFLFSHTGAAFNTVMTGSTNLMKNSAVNQFNDVYVDADNAPLHTAFAEIFDQMKQDHWFNPIYVRKVIGTRYEVQFLPWPDPSASNDPMINAMRPIRCTGATGAATPNGRTVVRVNLHVIKGSRGVYLAQRVRALYAAGCDVKVQYGLASRNVREVFQDATKRGKVPVHIHGYDTNEDDESLMDLYGHLKVLIVRGHYGDETNRQLTWTGSSNWSMNGVTGDEVILRIQGYGTAAAYMKNFNMIWTDFSHQAAWL